MENIDENIKVQEVRIVEFQGIKDFEQHFNGQPVILYGENTIGKSRIMRFIQIALGKQTDIPPSLISGEGEVITTKSGEKLTFKVKFKAGKPVVTVVNESGMQDQRKGTLEHICGAMGFDIFEFVEQSKSNAGRKKQIETIKGFLPPETQNDLARYEADVKAKFEERTNFSRDLKNLEGAIKSHPLYNESYANKLDDFKQTDITSVFAQLQSAEKSNNRIIEVETRRKSRANEISEHEVEVKELEAKLEKLKESILVKEKQNIDADAFLKSNSKTDTSIFEDQIKTANETNEKYKAAQDLKKKMADAVTLQDNIGELMVQIESGREMIKVAVQECTTIIDGLSFDDETLLLNGVPVNPSSLSTSEIMELGYRLKQIENPHAPLFIEGLESFGEEKMQALIEFSKTQNIQFFGEQVERGTKQIRFELIPA